MSFLELQCAMVFLVVVLVQAHAFFTSTSTATHVTIDGSITNTCGNLVSATISISNEQQHHHQHQHQHQQQQRPRKATESHFKDSSSRINDRSETRGVVRVRKSDRIVGGNEAASSAYPYISRLILSTGSLTYLCGGSLVHKDWIVTAAHCLNGMVYLTALIGGTDLGDLIEFEARDSAEFYIHPNFNATTSAYDVGLVKLSESSTITSFATPVYHFDRTTIEQYMQVGASSVVAGWGATSEDGPQSTLLLEAEVPIVSDEDCGAVFGDTFDPTSMFCAGGASEDACAGDSGGPIAASMRRDALLGIVSWGTGCARVGYFGVYTKITEMESFISLHVQFGTLSVTPSISPSISISPSAGYFIDCNGNSFTSVSLFGDGTCNVNFACSKFNYDEGDCLIDCNGNPAPSKWLGDGYCDNGSGIFHSVSIVLDCNSYNFDLGDCPIPSLSPSSSVSASSGSLRSKSSRSVSPTASPSEGTLSVALTQSLSATSSSSGSDSPSTSTTPTPSTSTSASTSTTSAQSSSTSSSASTSQSHSQSHSQSRSPSRSPSPTSIVGPPSPSPSSPSPSPAHSHSHSKTRLPSHHESHHHHHEIPSWRISHYASTWISYLHRIADSLLGVPVSKLLSGSQNLGSADVDSLKKVILDSAATATITQEVFGYFQFRHQITSELLHHMKKHNNNNNNNNNGKIDDHDIDIRMSGNNNKQHNDNGGGGGGDLLFEVSSPGCVAQTIKVSRSQLENQDWNTQKHWSRSTVTGEPVEDESYVIGLNVQLDCGKCEAAGD